MIYPSVAHTARQYIAKGQTREAINFLLKQKNLSKQVASTLKRLQANYMKLHRSNYMRLIKYDNYILGQNNIAWETLQLISKISKF